MHFDFFHVLTCNAPTIFFMYTLFNIYTVYASLFGEIARVINIVSLISPADFNICWIYRSHIHFNMKK